MGCASMARALLPWDDGERCPVGVLRSYVRAMLWVQAVAWPLEMASVGVSLRGTMMEGKEKRGGPMRWLLTAHTA